MAIQTMSATEVISINQGYLRLKRALDIFFTLPILLPLLCLMLLVAICIRLDSQGPIFYRQKRVGKDGATFDMYKFRTMDVNNDATTHREAITKYIQGQKLNELADSASPYKLGNDPRITKVGRILRKTSIDELPQFINILRGEMSLVGPRPPLPYEVELYSARDLMRLRGQPGLTGIWQVYGRSRVDFQGMIDMDIHYLQTQSLWLDVKLILLTVPVMVSGKGGA